MPKDYSCVDHYPENVDAAGVVARLLDGLGFRFFWATHGLEEDDFDFSPKEGSNTLGWMVRHVWGLMNWIHLHAFGSQASRPSSITDQRDHALGLIWTIRSHVAHLTSDELAEIRIEGLPFWHMVNGPISDAISHVGQINYVRRMMGKPSPGANVFTCNPPPGWPSPE